MIWSYKKGCSNRRACPQLGPGPRVPNTRPLLVDGEVTVRFAPGAGKAVPPALEQKLKPPKRGVRPPGVIPSRRTAGSGRNGRGGHHSARRRAGGSHRHLVQSPQPSKTRPRLPSMSNEETQGRSLPPTRYSSAPLPLTAL